MDSIRQTSDFLKKQVDDIKRARGVWEKELKEIYNAIFEGLKKIEESGYVQSHPLYQHTRRFWNDFKMLPETKNVSDLAARALCISMLIKQEAFHVADMYMEAMDSILREVEEAARNEKSKKLTELKEKMNILKESVDELERSAGEYRETVNELAEFIDTRETGLEGREPETLAQEKNLQYYFTTKLMR